MRIIDGRANFGTSHAEMVQRVYVPRAVQHGVTVPPVTDIAPGAPLPARVNAGRWIVDCPVCRGAEFAWFEALLFWCFNCLNAQDGHRWRRVAMPAEWAQIEAVLSVRPNPDNRNWEPGETLRALVAENIAHGLPEGVP